MLTGPGGPFLESKKPPFSPVSLTQYRPFWFPFI
jgi:hypothetical protein